MRQQLAVFKRNVPRPKLNNRDRLFWIGLYMIWQDWKSALIFVKPETVSSWQHKPFRRYWWKLSQPKQPGRPRTRSEIRRLIQTMATANPTWGAPRVHGELKKLGFKISERTVSRLMPKKTGRPSQTWMTFLRNHVGQIVSVREVGGLHCTIGTSASLINLSDLLFAKHGRFLASAQSILRECLQSNYLCVMASK